MRAYKRLKLWILLRKLEREQTILESHLLGNVPHSRAGKLADQKLRMTIQFKHETMLEILRLGGKAPESKIEVIPKVEKPKI